MKQFFLSFCIIIILSFFPENIALSLDKLNDDASKNDFNIVLITIDALRADHLSCYGYERKTSPNIDKIAEKGITFKNAFAPSSWTTPSMVSLFTSVYPTNHGVIHGFGYKKNITIYVQEVFSKQLDTLAQILKTRGYTTFGVTSNPHLDEQFGFARGFDMLECLFFLPADHVHKTIISWENKIKKSDKFFLWIHYIDPHHRYHQRKPWINSYASNDQLNYLDNLLKSSKEKSEKFLYLKNNPKVLSALVACYDSEISYVDSYIGEIIQKFKLDKNTLIIITSDHGEEFLEHDGLGHGNNLHQETLRIPLIIKLPHSSKEQKNEQHVNLIDIMPTILHVLNINPPDQILGKSCLEGKEPLSWQKRSVKNNKTVYNFAELDTESSLKTIITSEWKYIYNYKDKVGQLYNIKLDPLELNNLVDEKTKQANKLKEQLFNWVSDSKNYPTQKHHFQLSPKEKEKLKGLGYIE